MPYQAVNHSHTSPSRQTNCDIMPVKEALCLLMQLQACLLPTFYRILIATMVWKNTSMGLQVYIMYVYCCVCNLSWIWGGGEFTRPQGLYKLLPKTEVNWTRNVPGFSLFPPDSDNGLSPHFHRFVCIYVWLITPYSSMITPNMNTGRDYFVSFTNPV